MGECEGELVSWCVGGRVGVWVSGWSVWDCGYAGGSVVGRIAYEPCGRIGPAGVIFASQYLGPNGIKCTINCTTLLYAYYMRWCVV